VGFIMRRTTAFVGTVAVAIGAWVALGMSVADGTHAESSLLSFSPVADARVEQANPDANYGYSRRLVTDEEPAAERRSYLKFEVSGISGPVTNAKLRLYSEAASVDGPELRPVVTNWDENSITWNTRPAATAGPVDDTAAIPPYSWVEFDVTDLMNGDGTYAFRLSQYSHDGVTFASREATTGRPELLVETNPPSDHTVVPTAETTPVSHSGDAADDAAIWVNPSDPARSTIIGTDKLGGIAVYDLAGTQLQYRDQTAKYNNVDLRTDFPLGGQRVALVAASDRTKYYTSTLSQYYRSIVLYNVDPATGALGGPVGTITAEYEPYGLCMYRSQTSGKFYVFVTSRYPVGGLDGYVEQWELSDNGSGQITAEKVRVFGVGSQTEGCVADDEMGHLYLAEEDVGIWKYPAEPNAGLNRLLVDSTGPEGHLVADVEGLTITYGPNGTGHLLASSQGNNTYTVYRREGSNAYLQTFTVWNGGDTDGTTDTDGIDATTASLGSSFPSGLFVAQDGANTTPSGSTANQNYKLVPLQHILEP
jgi:3-phytase